MGKCRITVLRNTLFKDLTDKYYEKDFIPCTTFKEGDVFMTHEQYGFETPVGFNCTAAWEAMSKIISLLTNGVKVYGRYVNIACCNDGSRPVLFLLEALDDDGNPLDDRDRE